MAVVASLCAVGVALDALIGVACLGLLVRCRGVAINTGKLRIIRRNLVAIAADRSVVGNREPRVIESRAGPRGRRTSRLCDPLETDFGLRRYSSSRIDAFRWTLFGDPSISCAVATQLSFH